MRSLLASLPFALMRSCVGDAFRFVCRDEARQCSLSSSRVTLLAQARAVAAAADLGLAGAITQLHALRDRSDPLAALVGCSNAWLTVGERVTALHRESEACIQLAAALSSSNSEVRACRKAAAPESKEAQAVLRSQLQLRDAARVSWREACTRLLKQLPALYAPDGNATGVQASLEATRAFQCRVAQAAAAAGLATPSPAEFAVKQCLVETVRERRAALHKLQVAQAEAQRRTNAVAKLASSYFLATADRLAGLQDLALPRIQLPASLDPGAPAAFAAAVVAESKQYAEMEAVANSWLGAFQRLVLQIASRLNSLMHVTRAVPPALTSAQKLESLEDDLKERHDEFLKCKRKLKRKIARLDPDTKDSDNEMGEEELKAAKVELERELCSALGGFHRDWEALLHVAKHERPELLQRVWCAQQPWAQEKKGCAKLAAWVEAALTHLDSHGLEKPELSLEAYSDRKLLPAGGANHSVYVAVSPSGARVALKRFTATRPQDRAALKKVRPARLSAASDMPHSRHRPDM